MLLFWQLWLCSRPCCLSRSASPSWHTQQINKTSTSRTFEYVDLDHDGAGNLVSRIQKLWAAGTTASPVTTPGDTGTGTTTYLYDGAGRMTSATGPKANGTSATWTYAYDGQGNRTSFSGPGPSGATVTLTTTTDNQGWPVSIEDPSTGASPDVMLAHDEAGDLVSYDAQGSASDLGFSYDAWGLTSSGTAAGTSATYALDPLGRIASRSQGAETIAYDYAGGAEDAVRSVATGGANPGTTSFAFAPGGPLASSKAGVTQVYLGDLHGDVVGSIVPGATSLSSSAWYSAYGERTALTGTAPVLGYQGDVTDPLTGTVDMLTRNYLPMLGRFTSRDVLAGDPSEPPSLNQFVYATGSPVTFSDPTGMCARPGDCPDATGGGNHHSDGGNDWNDVGEERSTAYMDAYGDYVAAALPDAPITPAGVRFNPAEYGTWVGRNTGTISAAGSIFGVPRSAIAAALTVEHGLDPRDLSAMLGEAGLAGVCGLPIVGGMTAQIGGHNCQRTSFGVGQVQLRRAELVDNAVRDGIASYACGRGDCGTATWIREHWDGNRSAIISRLGNNQGGILYTAAYLSLLRDTAPGSANWDDIYGTTYDAGIGSYNGDPAFVAAFALAKNYYSYLDVG